MTCSCCNNGSTSKNKCYCDSNLAFDCCCKPFLENETKPLTAESLMRSRYSAYCTLNLEYLLSTSTGHALEQTPSYIEPFNWQNLTILSKKSGTETDDTGTVEFKATFEQNGRLYSLHEISQFQKIDGHWFYSEGLRLT